jgi:hypothetical protein
MARKRPQAVVGLCRWNDRFRLIASVRIGPLKDSSGQQRSFNVSLGLRPLYLRERPFIRARTQPHLSLSAKWHLQPVAVIGVFKLSDPVRRACGAHGAALQAAFMPTPDTAPPQVEKSNGACVGHWIGAAAFGLLLAAPPALAEEPKEEEVYEPSALLLRPLVPTAAAAAAQPDVPSHRPGFAEAAFAVSVVELPLQGAQLGPQRRHHAISFATERLKELLRSLGLDATDCSTRLRFPSRLRQSNLGIKAEVQGQVQFGCSF